MENKEQLDLLQPITLSPNGSTITKKEKTVSCFKVYKYATPLDLLLICVGMATSIVCGIMPPYITVCVGDVTGVLANYVDSIRKNLTHEERALATEKLFFGTQQFAITISEASIVIIFCTYIAVMCFTYSSTRQTLKIRKLLFGKILDQDISWHKQNNTVNFGSMITTDISKIEDGIGEKVGVLIFIKTIYIASIMWAVMRGSRFAMVCIILFPLRTILTAILIRFLTKYRNQESAAYSATWVIGKEILNLIKTVVAFGAEERESKRFGQYLEQAQRRSITRHIFNGIIKAIYCFLTYPCYGLALWYGVNLVIQESSLPEEEIIYTPGNMMAIFLVTLLASNHYWTGGLQLLSIKEGRTAAFKVFQILDSKIIMPQHNDIGERPDLKSDIAFENVTFSNPARPNEQILNGITMKLSFGETIALVGPFGSGKSVVIQLLQKLYDPSSGDILIDGISLKDIKINHLMEKVGVVSENPLLFTTTTIADNIRYGNLSAAMDDIVKAARLVNAHEFISDLSGGYETILSEMKDKLSEDEKLKISLARTLIKEPRLLILDEIAILLRVTNKFEVQAALHSVFTSSIECTKIIITDRLSTLRKVSRIIVFDGGKIIEEGLHEELIETKGVYYNMIQSGKIYEQQNDSTLDTEPKSLFSVLYEEGENKYEELKKENEYVDPTNHKGVYLKILKLYRQEWLYVITSWMALLINGIIPLIYGLILGNIMGELSVTDNIAFGTKAHPYCFDLIYLGISSGIFMFVQIFAMGYADAKLTGTLRKKIFSAMVKQEIGWFDRKENSARALSLQLASDPRKIQMVGLQICLILNILSILLISTVISLYIEWRLALIVGIFYPLIVFAVFYEKKYINTEADFIRKVSDKSAKIAMETINKIDIVKVLECENILYESYLKELLYFTKSRKSHLRGLILGCARSLHFLVYAAAIAYGAVIISRSEVDAAVVFQILLVMVPSALSIGTTLSLLPDVQKGILSAGFNIFSLLDRVPLIRSYRNDSQRKWENTSIELSKIHFSYPTGPSVEVISGFDLPVPHGKTVALYGGSTCAKLSIIELLMRFYDPAHGEIKVGNDDIRNVDLHCLRSQLGLITKDPNLFDLTVAENIGYGVSDRPVLMEEIIDAAKFANIHNFIASLPLGYETRLGAKGPQLTASQKQRISIARVLLRNPKVLLLYEVTSALDDESKEVIEEVLDQARQGRTCIVVSQDLATTAKSDIMCVLKERSLVGTVTHEEILAIKAAQYNKLQSSILKKNL